MHEDGPVHGPHQVGGQGDGSVMVLLLCLCDLGVLNHTGGLPQDCDLLLAEAQVKEVPQDMTELVCINKISIINCICVYT